MKVISSSLMRRARTTFMTSKTSIAVPWCEDPPSRIGESYFTYLDFEILLPLQATETHNAFLHTSFTYILFRRL